MAVTPRLILVTAPNIEEARKLAKEILDRHLAACVKLLPGIESHYWWQGQLHVAPEIQLLIKSSAEQFEALSEVVRKHHSYECPEIIAIAPAEIAPAYREWWEKETRKPSGT